MPTERLVQGRIMAYLAKLKREGHPIMYERRQAGGFSYKKGLPDIYLVYAGEHIEVEVKKPGGVLSTTQETWMRRFAEIGIPYICADNIDSFIKFMGRFIYYGDTK